MVIQKSNRLFYHVGLPMIIGTIIYLGWRSQNLFMFQWIEWIGLNDLINDIRLYTLKISLPLSFIYSVPDGLWNYSLMSLMILIWSDSFSFPGLFWFFLSPLCSYSMEMGQWVGLVPGTFDVLDILAITISSIIPLTLKHNYENILQNRFVCS